MSLFNPVWAEDGNVEVPSEAQVRQGFVCGPVSPGLFNYLFQILETTINSLGIEDLTPSSRRIDTGPGLDGGGDLTQDRTLRLNIPGLESETEVSDDDEIVMFDASRNMHVRITRSDFAAGFGGGGGSIAGGANIGTGTGEAYSGVSGTNLQFRRLLNAGGLVIATVDNDVTFTFADMGAALTAE